MRIFTAILTLCCSSAFAQESQNDQLLDYLNKALDTDSTDYYFNKASSIKSGNEQDGIFQYYLLLNQLDDGNLDSAEWHGTRGLSFLEDETDISYKRRIAHQLMMINRDKGLLDKSLEYCLMAYNLVVSEKDTAQIARYLTERAFIHHDFEQFELGIKSGKQAWEVWRNNSQAVDFHLVYILNSIAINFDDWNKPDSALAYYDRILSIESMKGSEELGPIFNNQGNTLMKQGRYAEAYTSLKKSFNIQKGGSGNYYYYDQATVINNLGIIQSHFENWDSAQYFLDLAEAYADSSDSFEKKRDSYLAQFQLAEKKRNLTKALDYQTKYFAIKDSIFQKDRAASIARMEAEYETAKKEQQIAIQDAQIDEQEALLERNRIALIFSMLSLILLIISGLLWRNRIKKKQQLKIQEERIRSKESELNATISSQEKERARYARDLHDGFGQMISILNMHLGNLKNDSKPNERQTVYEASEKVITEMYDELKSICFNLMPQTLVQEGLQSGLEEFVNRVNATNKLAIETNFFGLEKRLSEVQEISLYRIIQEWINNILKYSEAQKIVVQITKDDAEITLTIEDNGKGFDKELLAKSNGNGWKNIHSRASLIKGEVEIETSDGGNGTTFILNAPVPITIEKNTIETV